MVRFPAPNNPTPEQAALIADIVGLDHRSLHRLGHKSQERQEVKRLIWNAVNAAFGGGSLKEGRLLYAKAEQAYYDHVQIRNRLRYLLGAVIGTIVAAVLGALSVSVADYLEPFVPARLLVLIMVFAGLGSITSVLNRLSSIDLRQEQSDLLILLSGATKPVVAVVLAIVVFVIIDLKIIDIRVGSAQGEKSNGLYLITSFFCGFSERFATDVISRVPFVKGA